jgi:hypothetical protein
MDGPPAQSLTFEGLLPSTMKEPPRDPNTPVIDRLMIGKIGKRRGKRGRKGRVRGKGEGGIY